MEFFFFFFLGFLLLCSFLQFKRAKQDATVRGIGFIPPPPPSNLSGASTQASVWFLQALDLSLSCVKQIQIGHI